MSFADYPVARYIAIFILSWNIAWYIIYLITGFHLRTVGISNGILGSYITLSTTKFNISIGKIKLILWGNRKLIIDDVHVSLNGDEEKHQKSKYTDKKNSSDEITPLSVFPKNPLLKAILRYTAKRIPKIDIEVRNSKVDIHEGNTLALDFLRITLNSRNSKRYNETVKFSGQVFLNDISYITVTGECPVVTDTIKLQLNWQIDLSTGVIYKITTKLYLEYLSVKTFTLIKNISKILERTKNQDITEQNNFQDSSSSSTSSELITKLHRIHRKLYSTVDEVAIHIENVSFTEIPLLDSNNDASIKNYINTHHLPNLSLEYMTKSIAVNYLRLSNKSPAFQVLFDQISDNPFHLTVSIQLFKINYSKLIKTSKDKFINDTEEILNIPQFGFTFKSNVLDHLARGDGFKNCVMELFTSASSPILDLDVVQLTSIVYSVHMITKYIKLLNQRKNNTNSIQEEEKSEEISIRETEFDSESDDLSQSAKSTDSVKKKLLKLLHDNYPKLEVKISFEQPRFIIRDECGINEGMVQLLNFLYSFLNIHLLTTSNREYDISCTFLHPTVQYIEKDIADLDKKIIKTDIFSLKSVTINLDVLKDFKIKPKFKFEDVTINLSELEVLEGIGGVLNKVAGIIDNDLTYGLLNLSLNEVISKEITLIAVEPKRKTNFEKSIFRKLPFWLLEVNISISNISIILGSRSMFIPSESLIDPNSESANFLEDFVGLNQELRTTSITLNNFRLSLLNEEVMREIQNTTEVSKLDDEDIRNTGDISAEETEKDVKPCCWAILIKALALKVLVNHNQTSSSKFLTIPLINLNTIARPLEVPRGSGKLFLSSSIGEINGNYDRYNLFVVLGSVFLLKEFILEPIRQIKQKLKKDIGKINLDDNEQEMLTPETGGLNFLSCDFEVVKTDFILHLSDNFKTRLQLFDLKLGLNESILSLSNSILRFLTVSPIIKSLWTRVLVVDDLKVQLDLNKVIKFFKSNPIPTATKEDLGSKVNPIIEVDASSIRFIQPHQFVVYHLFDNLSISIKVIKHLLQNLAHEDDNSSSDASKHQHKSNCQIVVPHESKPVKVPPTRIRSKKINFLMEDDPFEGELTMIYQLGLAEQRKRLEEYELFSRRIELHNDTLTKEQYESKLDELHKVMSMSWIRKVKVYNAMVNDEIVRNKKYLFGNEAHAIPSELNDDIVPYMLRAPLFLINLDEFDLLAQSTQFALKELPQFLYDIGQQVPKDTVYSMILPTYLELKLGELRIHLRDYPLPLLHVPANIDKSPSLTTSGHFIVAENLVTAKEHLRELIIPLIKDLETKVIKPVDGGDFAPNLSHEEEDTKLGAHRIIIQKSLSTVKIYSDLKFRFQSAQSSRFIWGQSYQFALQQTIMNFDQFSKPPVDPLKKLGIWDKLRYIIHGNFRISVADIGDLQIAIKGSRDPYNLFGASSGFVLGFKDSVEWKINEHDDPRLFFEIVSDKVSFFVPNYLAAPLYAWTRPSNKSIYMPGSKNFVSSTFGYYLEDIPQQDEKDYVNLNKSVLEKNVLKLNGGVNFKVGFLLQRDEIGKKNSKLMNRCLTMKWNYAIQNIPRVITIHMLGLDLTMFIWQFH